MTPVVEVLLISSCLELLLRRESLKHVMLVSVEVTALRVHYEVIDEWTYFQHFAILRTVASTRAEEGSWGQSARH